VTGTLSRKLPQTGGQLWCNNRMSETGVPGYLGPVARSAVFLRPTLSLKHPTHTLAYSARVRHFGSGRYPFSGRNG
jgi:hypothetical protein